MRLSFHGAAQTVTGSQHLLEINGKKLLLDCGLYQGRRRKPILAIVTFPSARVRSMLLFFHMRT